MLIIILFFNKTYQKNVCEQSSKFSMFDSLAIFVVDAMRLDFVPTIHDSNSLPKWKFVENLAETNGNDKI